MQSLMILGRQPALGLAELESLYGPEKLRPVGAQAVMVDVDPCLLAFDRLGGSIKFCKVLTSLDTTDWQEIEKFLIKVSPGHSERIPEGKMQLGLSVIGLDISLKRIEATGLNLKKAIRKTGRSVRLIPNKGLELNSASVLHNKLTGPTGWELVLIRDGEKTIIAQTVKVQDITSYTKRDRGRPKRDPRIGMLPPKLAQIIINLASGKLPEDKLESICDIPAGEPIPYKLLDKTLLDPFCGTGVVLQEALLMGYEAFGSDIDARMVSYSQANLSWLNELFDFSGDNNNGSKSVQNVRKLYYFETGDATSHRWSSEPDFVASETYLGRPFTALPSPETLQRTVSDCNLIIKKFLQNIHSQVNPGTRFCLAVPAWQIKPNQFKHLPLIDQISDLGYNRVNLQHARSEDLVYYRPDQIVARELLIITRN